MKVPFNSEFCSKTQKGNENLLCAIYCRLSKEDSAGLAESESIQNQKSLLVKYAVEREWDIYQIYSDDDYSGADSERPAFNSMLEAAQSKCFDIVLCKTQSRFTRDMELVEKYIHTKFLLWGIRFVTAVDNVDTGVKGNKKARQINGLINEWYLEDLSENIKAVFDSKRKNGQYIGSFAAYGYEKSPDDHNKLVVDEYAAEVVRQIYKLYLAGNGKLAIAHILNSQGILNPTKHKQSKGYAYINGSQANEYGLWNRTSVGRILQNELYIGVMVQGRKRKISYKSKLVSDVPKEQWVKVEDTHTAIVDNDTFQAVQKLLKTRTRTDGSGGLHLLAGKVKCMDCGSTLSKVSNKYKGKINSYLRCKLHLSGGKRKLCSSHSIRLDLLMELVSDKIRRYVTNYYEINNMPQIEPIQETQYEKQLAELQRQVNRRSEALKALYLDKVSGIISEEQFFEMNSGFLSEKKALEIKISAINEKMQKKFNRQDSATLLEQAQDLLKLEVIPRELINLLVDSVEVGEKNPDTGDQEVRINWCF